MIDTPPEKEMDRTPQERISELEMDVEVLKLLVGALVADKMPRKIRGELNFIRTAVFDATTVRDKSRSGHGELDTLGMAIDGVLDIAQRCYEGRLRILFEKHHSGAGAFPAQRS